MRDRAWRVADALFLALFILSVAVQVNDPDPLGWITIYGAAALVCGLSLRRRPQTLLPAIIAAVAVLWASTLSPRVVGHVPFLEMFGAWEMRDIGIEESREMYGLLIVAGWMTLHSIRSWRARRAPPASQDSAQGA
jgi:hypothetical protein